MNFESWALLQSTPGGDGVKVGGKRVGPIETVAFDSKGKLPSSECTSCLELPACPSHAPCPLIEWSGPPVWHTRTWAWEDCTVGSLLHPLFSSTSPSSVNNTITYSTVQAKHLGIVSDSYLSPLPVSNPSASSDLSRGWTSLHSHQSVSLLLCHQKLKLGIF